MKIIITIEDELSKNENKEAEKPIRKEVEVSTDGTKWFDYSSNAWTKVSEYNLMYLQTQQRYANDRLLQRGCLFLNEVYDMLGIPRTRAGQIVGWIYDKENPIGNNFVDFGLKDEYNSDFINGISPNALLKFNVDGCILDRF